VNKNVMLERLSDLDLNQLPHVEQARGFIREAQPDQRRQPDTLDKLKYELAEVNRLIAAADPNRSSARVSTSTTPSRKGKSPPSTETQGAT
jgi:hypothetical protein